MSEWSYLSFKCNVSKQQHPMWVFIYNVNEMVRRHLVFSCTNLLCEGIPRVFSFKHFKWGHQRLKNDMLMFRVLVWSYLCLKIFYWFAGDEWNVKSPWIKLATRCRTKKKGLWLLIYFLVVPGAKTFTIQCSIGSFWHLMQDHREEPRLLQHGKH